MRWKPAICATFLTFVTTAAAAPAITDDDARKTILENRNRWKDPDSIKDAKVGQPHACTRPTFPGGGTKIVNVSATCVCLELNARNSYGGYVGATPVIVVFNQTGLIETISTGRYSGFDKYCIDMKPFPEMNGQRP